MVELEVDDPRPGGIRVRTAASGLCHSDDHHATGDMKVGILPFAGGHEGAGVVEAVGPHTPGFAEGDHVVFSFLPACGRCRHVGAALRAVRKAGTCVVVGSGETRTRDGDIPLTELVLYQKRLQGCLFGACAPTADIPAQLRLYLEGTLKLDELVTTRYTLDDIAQGFADLHAGRNLRGVVVF